MFGGILNDYNDLWRYNIATNTWTWMKGSNTTGQPATYGVQGVEDPANTPGASCVYSAWKDLSGNFWMWGGESFFMGEDKNEMWRFNPVTNNWAWIGGNTVGNTNPIFGTQCVADSMNDPGGRFENRACWQDAADDFYFFGGGIDALNAVRNDLWKYCVASGQWTWLKGDTILNPAGSWGTLGVPSPTNVPNGRGGSVGWSDQSGKIYMFGGSPGGYVNPYNDLWVYTIDNACGSCNTMPVALFTATHPICPGTCTDFTNLSMNGFTFQWFFPGANPSFSTDVSPQGICYNTPGSYDVTLIASNASGSDTLTLMNYMTVYPYPPAQGITQSGDTLFSNQGATSYQWYHNGILIPGATDYFFVAQASGNYNVVATDGNGCEVEAVIFDVIASIENNSGDSHGITVFPNPVDNILSVTFKRYPRSPWTFHIYNSVGELVTDFNLIDPDHDRYRMDIDIKNLATGVYYLDLLIDSKSFRTKFIKM
jgi:PKD repeat protein